MPAKGRPVKGARGSPRSPRRRKAGRGGRAWGALLLVLACLAAVGLVSAAVAVRVIEAGLPPIPSWDEYADAAPKVSRVLDADGSVVAEFFTERRTLSFPDRLPANLVRAVLAAEDDAFFEHQGLSYLGIARAMVVNFWRGRVTQGGSTLTQQVVKQVLLTPERTYERKGRELLLARQLERKLSKDEILAIYLSEIYLGHGRYGFEEGARFYFGKRAADLSLPEAALIAGLVSAPEANTPLRNPRGALERQHYVLRRMTDLGWITDAQAREAAATPLTIWAKDEPRLGAAAYFVDAVRREVLRTFGEGRLLHDGLTVETTLDLDVSDAAEAAVTLGLGALWAKGRTREADEEASDRPDGMDDGSEDGMPPAPRSVRARVIACDPGAGRIEVQAGGERAVVEPASLSRLVSGGRPDLFQAVCARRELTVSRAPGVPLPDGKTEARVNAELGPQAVLVVLDPASRAVRALVGGEDPVTRPFNRAVQSRRPIGSTVKPFLYAAALQSGVGADETFENTAISFRGARGRSWTPRNYEGGYDGRSYGLGEALAKSVNVVAVKVMSRIGPGPVADLLAALGADGDLPRDLSLALGSAEASPLALANAFAAFADDGRHDTPYLVQSVRDARGRELLSHERRPSRQLPAEVARTVRGWMRQAVLTGTAQGARDLPVPAWGKTGTTNRSREAWFAGSDGRHVVAVQVAYDDRLPMHGATGGNTAVPFFAGFVRMLER